MSPQGVEPAIFAELEAGSHEELIARRGRNAELFELQAAGYRKPL